MSETPGGAIKGRPLHFIWLCDCSGSMEGSKIQQLNFAIKESLPEMLAVVSHHPNAEVFVRAIAFSSGARWLVSQPTPLANFRWTDLSAGGCTDLGEALRMIGEQLDPSRMPERGLPPVIVLISDGQPTDDFSSGLKALMAQKWGSKAVRVAIGIGHDVDKGVLTRFVGNPEIPVLEANNPGMLVDYIRWASTTLMASVISPPSQVASGGPASSTALATAIPMAPADSGGNDVW